MESYERGRAGVGVERWDMQILGREEREMHGYDTHRRRRFDCGVGA